MLTYPLTLSFKTLAFSPQIVVRDGAEAVVAFVSQKALRLKRDVTVYADESRATETYRIKADSMMQWNTVYRITTGDDTLVGTVRRRGGQSLWRATYQVFDQSDSEVALIHEENPWVKVGDTLLSLIPYVALFTGLLLNPTYVVEVRGQPTLRLRKRRALLEGRFSLEQLGSFTERDERLLLPSVLAFTMVERRRG